MSDTPTTIPSPTGSPAGKSGEPLESQTERLARFIVANVPGEPSADYGAIDCAMAVITRLQTQLAVQAQRTPAPASVAGAKIDDGDLRIAADSNLIIIGDANLFDHGWKNDSEAKDAFVLDIGVDWTKVDPVNLAQIEQAKEQAALVCKRVPKTVNREQLSDGTWRLHVIDGNQAGQIRAGCQENIARDDLKVVVVMTHKDQSRVRVLDACRERGFGKVSVPGQHRMSEFLGFAMKDPLRYKVYSDENGAFKVEFFLR